MPRARLSELAALVAIAEHRSFSGAARSLNVSPSALSHSMRGFEARLEVRLLNRTTRSVALTDAGEQLLRRVRPAIADIDDAVDQVTSGRNRPSGSIRITTSESGARLLIQHVLPAFFAAYPEIEVEFVQDTKLVDIVAGGFDAGIRVFDDVPRDMIAVKFGPEMRFIAVASPEYLCKHKEPTSPRDLAQHRCIRFRFESGVLYKWHLERRGRADSIDVGGPITVSNLNLAIDAAMVGLGIAWIPEDRVADHLAQGRLVQVLNAWSPAFPGLCLYYPANRHAPTALRLFAQAVREWAGQYQNAVS